MKFWDASAFVPLLVMQASTSRMQALVNEDSGMFVWWGTGIECVSALARTERIEPHVQQAIARAWISEAEGSRVGLAGGGAERVGQGYRCPLLRVHPLRAADSLQLAAAFVGAERHPPALEFVTLDERLAAAARKEGFILVDA